MPAGGSAQPQPDRRRGFAAAVFSGCHCSRQRSQIRVLKTLSLPRGRELAHSSVRVARFMRSNIESAVLTRADCSAFASRARDDDAHADTSFQSQGRRR